MDNDNLYQPRGGLIMSEPETQKVERDVEVTKTLAQLPVLEAEVEHLESRIAFYESVNSIPEESLVRPDDFMHIVASNKLTAQNLKNERDDLIGRIREASKA